MKNKLIFASLLLTCALLIFNFCGSNVALAQPENYSKLIVSGNAEINVKPNLAIIYIGIETSNTDVEQAQKENSQKLADMKNVLIDFNIEEKDIRTSMYNIYKEYEYINNERKLKNFTVSNIIEVKTKDLDRVGELITKLVENNANVVNGVNFTCENPDDYYLEALQKAIDNANAKASALIGNKTFEIMEINETNYYFTPVFYHADMAKGYAENASLFSGELTIKANIKVTYMFS